MDIVAVQFFVLLAGTIFAWYNFLMEFKAMKKGKKCKVGCSVNVKNPFLTPCFGGVVFFTTAFLLNLFLL